MRYSKKRRYRKKQRGGNETKTEFSYPESDMAYAQIYGLIKNEALRKSVIEEMTKGDEILFTSRDLAPKISPGILDIDLYEIVVNTAEQEVYNVNPELGSGSNPTSIVSYTSDTFKDTILSKIYNGNQISVYYDNDDNLFLRHLIDAFYKSAEKTLAPALQEKSFLKELFTNNDSQHQYIDSIFSSNGGTNTKIELMVSNNLVYSIVFKNEAGITGVKLADLDKLKGLKKITIQDDITKYSAIKSNTVEEVIIETDTLTKSDQLLFLGGCPALKKITIKSKDLKGNIAAVLNMLPSGEAKNMVDLKGSYVLESGIIGDIVKAIKDKKITGIAFPNQMSQFINTNSATLSEALKPRFLKSVFGQSVSVTTEKINDTLIEQYSELVKLFPTGFKIEEAPEGSDMKYTISEGTVIGGQPVCELTTTMGDGTKNSRKLKTIHFQKGMTKVILNGLNDLTQVSIDSDVELTEINITDCKNGGFHLDFSRTGHIGIVSTKQPTLTSIVITGCNGTIDVAAPAKSAISMEKLDALTRVDIDWTKMESLTLIDCKVLGSVKLPTSLTQLTITNAPITNTEFLKPLISLTNIVLSGCSKFNTLTLPEDPVGTQKKDAIVVLNLDGCASLKNLNLDGYSKLQTLSVKPPDAAASSAASSSGTSYSNEMSLTRVDIISCIALDTLFISPSVETLVINNASSLSDTNFLSGLNLLKQLTIQQCPKIENLILKNIPNSFAEFKEGFAELKTLEIDNCDKLASINMVAPQLESMKITGTPVLTTLIVQNTKNNTAFSSFVNLTNLKTLVIEQVKILRLDIENCPSLSNQNGILKLPTTLKFLSIGGNGNFGDAINNLTQLITFNMDGNKQTTNITLPAEITECSITNSGINVIITEKCKKTLKKMTVTNCAALTRVGDDKQQGISFTDYDALITLSVQNSLCTAVVLSNCLNLNSLILDNNPITDYTVRNLPVITELTIPDTVTSVKAENINALKTITYTGTAMNSFDVENCGVIDSIPNFITNKTNITLLKVSNCPKIDVDLVAYLSGVGSAQVVPGGSKNKSRKVSGGMNNKSRRDKRLLRGGAVESIEKVDFSNTGATVSNVQTLIRVVANKKIQKMFVPDSIKIQIANEQKSNEFIDALKSKNTNKSITIDKITNVEFSLKESYSKKRDAIISGLKGVFTQIADEQAAKIETERLAAEKVAEEQRLAKIEADKVEAERVAEEERLAKIEAERLAAEKVAEEERLAKIEAERLAAEKVAEEQRLTKIEADRLAAEKVAEEQRLAKIEADKVEAERVAEEERLAKIEAERLAAEKVAEEQRLAKIDADKEAARIAAEKTEQERLAKIEAERLAAEKVAEEQRLAKIEADRLAAEKVAEEQRLAKIEADRVEVARIAAEKTEQERLAKIEAERVEAARIAETERLAKIEAERLAAEKVAEEQRLAKIDAERLAAEKVAEEQRLAKIEVERLAAEKAETERLAKIEADKEAARIAEEERLVKIEAERIAAEKAETERLAKIESDRIAAEKVAEEQRLAKIEADKEAVRIAEEERLAKIETERLAAEKVAEEQRLAKIETERLAAEKVAEEQRLAKIETERLAAEKVAEEQRLAKIEADKVEAARIAEEQRLAKIEADRVEAARLAAEQAAKEKATKSLFDGPLFECEQGNLSGSRKCDSNKRSSLGTLIEKDGVTSLIIVSRKNDTIVSNTYENVVYAVRDTNINNPEQHLVLHYYKGTILSVVFLKAPVPQGVEPKKGVESNRDKWINAINSNLKPLYKCSYNSGNTLSGTGTAMNSKCSKDSFGFVIYTSTGAQLTLFKNNYIKEITYSDIIDVKDSQNIGSKDIELIITHKKPNGSSENIYLQTTNKDMRDWWVKRIKKMIPKKSVGKRGGSKQSVGKRGDSKRGDSKQSVGKRGGKGFRATRKKIRRKPKEPVTKSATH